MEVNNNLRLRLKKVLSVHCSPNELEDAVQEAMIHAWHMLNNGELDDRVIFFKSISKGRRVASPAHASKSLGKPRAEIGGYTTSQGRETKKRIMEYKEIYYKEHGKFPTNREIAKATGKSLGTISHHINNKSNNILSLEQVKHLSERPLASFDSIPEYFVASSINIESQVLSDSSFSSLLNVLNDDEKEILFLKHHADLSLEQVAIKTGYCVRTVTNRLKVAHHKIKQTLV